jgi:hypothetical protein
MVARAGGSFEVDVEATGKLIGMIMVKRKTLA